MSAKLEVENIKQLPVILGEVDVLKTAQLLPDFGSESVCRSISARCVPSEMLSSGGCRLYQRKITQEPYDSILLDEENPVLGVSGADADEKKQ